MSRNHTFKTDKGTELPILNLRGQDYLEVKYRIVWFREEHPDWSIETELLQSTDKHAVAKATIKDASGRVISTSHKREDTKDFNDVNEKAETSAIGRALALCGYGTQFTDDLDEGERIVDSPVSRRDNGPAPTDGAQGFIEEYRIDFGKYAKRSLEEVGPDALKSYIAYLEGQAVKDKKTLAPRVQDFVDRASAYIAALENTPLYPEQADVPVSFTASILKAPDKKKLVIQKTPASMSPVKPIPIEEPPPWVRDAGDPPEDPYL